MPNKKLKVKRIGQILDDLSEIQKFKTAIKGDWPLKDGDKVKLDIDTIKKHPEYQQRLPAYRRFCEENADKVFTVAFEEGLGKSVVSFVEDTTNPKWLFWIGDLKKAE